MDRPFLCPDCHLEHDEPASAVLGHQVRCMDCALTTEALAFQTIVIDVGTAAALAA